MRLLSRVCDAADWFDPAMIEVVRGALRETPRFHRKQWEFARIFLALAGTGVLRGSSVGLSLGAGRERLMYAVAPHVRHLIAADLYGPESGWPDACCDDPDGFIRAHRPFPMDDTRLTALRMDMRALEFGDAVLDFCYSSCAFEHIGGFDDFRQHLREVARVLKPGGIYAFTTEFHFGEELIAHPHNHLFPARTLQELVAESGLVPVTDVDARIVPHAINYPAPANPRAFAFAPEGSLPPALAHGETHVQLMRGRHAFTSVLLVLRKDPAAPRPGTLQFVGLDESRAFLAEGVAQVRSLMERCTIPLAPHAFLPGEAPPDRPPAGGALAAHGPLFHTDYVWLGRGARTIAVQIRPSEADAAAEGAVELRVHRYPAITAAPVECVAVELRDLGPCPGAWRIPLVTDDDSCYAVLGTCVGGRPPSGRVTIRVEPACHPVPASPSGPA